MKQSSRVRPKRIKLCQIRLFSISFLFCRQPKNLLGLAFYQNDGGICGLMFLFSFLNSITTLFTRFMEDTLIRHGCPKIKKFHLSYGCIYYYHDFKDPQLTSHIRFAVTKCVEELVLISNFTYLLPEFLLDNGSLVRLELESCYFMSNWRINWPNLKSLKMDCHSLSRYKCSNGIENVVSCCPLLELLELRESMDDNVAIVSKSLKVLSFVSVQFSKHIKISCPNLVEFNMSRSHFPPYRMIENVLLGSPLLHSLKLTDCDGMECGELYIASKSLKVLDLEYVCNTEVEVSCPNLVKVGMLCYGSTIYKMVKLSSSVCATLDYIEPEFSYSTEESRKQVLDVQTIKKLFFEVHHVSELTLKTSLIEVISALDVEDHQYFPLLRSKCLTLHIGASSGLALPGIAYALGSPMLETLVIKLDSEYDEHISEEVFEDLTSSRLAMWNSIRSTGFICLDLHLKTVKIIGLYEGDGKCKIALEFIEYILKNARVLEKMTVLLEKSKKCFEKKVYQKVMSFPRYSPSANV